VIIVFSFGFYGKLEILSILEGFGFGFRGRSYQIFGSWNLLTLAKTVELISDDLSA